VSPARGAGQAEHLHYEIKQAPPIANGGKRRQLSVTQRCFDGQASQAIRHLTVI